MSGEHQANNIPMVAASCYGCASLAAGTGRLVSIEEKTNALDKYTEVHEENQLHRRMWPDAGPGFHLSAQQLPKWPFLKT